MGKTPIQRPPDTPPARTRINPKAPAVALVPGGGGRGRVLPARRARREAGTAQLRLVWTSERPESPGGGFLRKLLAPQRGMVLFALLLAVALLLTLATG